MKKMKKRLVALGLAVAVAVPMGGSVFAQRVVVEYNPGATSSTGGSSSGTSGIVAPPSTSSAWKLSQNSVSLKVGQTSSVSLTDSTGQVVNPGTSQSQFSNAFVYQNGVLVSAPLENAPSDSSSPLVSDIVWTSSDESVATVQNGVINAKKLGRAVITATASDGTSSSCVAHVALKGVDVSTHQKNINWSAMKAQGIDFAMIRTGYGWENWETQKDAYFEANYAGALQNNIKVGAYHYSYATTADEAKKEAEFVLNILNGRALDFPVAFDIEDKCHSNLSPAQISEIVRAFCDTIEAAGYDSAVYSFTNFYNAKLTDPMLNIYDKWVAQWSISNPTYTGSFTMWQYGKENMPSIVGGNSSVDVNYCYYDYAGILNESQGGTISAASYQK